MHLIENHASKRGNLEKSCASRKHLPLVPLKNSRALVCPRKNHAPRAPSKVMFVRSQNSRASSALPPFSHDHEKNTRPRKNTRLRKITCPHTPSRNTRFTHPRKNHAPSKLTRTSHPFKNTRFMHPQKIKRLTCPRKNTRLM